jgi:hypothetical protein
MTGKRQTGMQEEASGEAGRDDNKSMAERQAEMIVKRLAEI